MAQQIVQNKNKRRKKLLLAKREGGVSAEKGWHNWRGTDKEQQMMCNISAHLRGRGTERTQSAVNCWWQQQQRDSNSSSEMATNLINLRLSISIIDNAQSVGHADKVLFIILSVTWLSGQVSPIYVAIMSTIDKYTYR